MVLRYPQPWLGSESVRQASLTLSQAAGMKLGRPKGPGKSRLDAFGPEIEALLANGSTQKFIARRYHTTEANLHNWMKKKARHPKAAECTASSIEKTRS